VLDTAWRYYAENEAEARQLAPSPLPLSPGGSGVKGEGNISPGEAAAWVAVLRIVLNLDEFLTRE
jgi:hypothetical protein